MKSSAPSGPPRLGRKLLSFLLNRGEHWELAGDFEELYAERAAEKGRASARAWYWRQIARFAPAYFFHSLLWSRDMFKNHMIVAWRNIKKSKAYSALNILGLAAGLAVFILIMLFVRTELSYDRYHTQAKNIFRIIREDPRNLYMGSNRFAVSPAPMAAALVRDFPDVRAAARIDPWTNVLLGVGDASFLEQRFFWADPQLFEIFSFPLVRGAGAAALKDPFSVLLSESAARRLFGASDPVGRTIRLLGQSKPFEFKVAGVFRDIPASSHFTMDFVAPFETIPKIDENYDFTRWDNNSFYTYVLLREGADTKALERKLPAWAAAYAERAGQSRGNRPRRPLLQPLTRIHLSGGINFDISPGGDPRFVFLFGSIAVLVLVIACVNYMNLATARSLKRAKEIGLRKVVGAARGQIIRQFLGDSLLMTVLALLLAVGAVVLALPAFSAFVEREIAFHPLHDAVLMPALLLLAVVVGTAAGSYPAFFVSAFRPASTLKGTGTSRVRGRGLRNALIVFQFAASIALIICTLGVRNQLAFIRNKDMGYRREQIVVITPRGGVREGLDAFKAELLRNPDILGVAASSSLPSAITSSTIARWPGMPAGVEIPIYQQSVDFDYVPLFGLQIVQGRSFSRDFPSDARGAYLINETARKVLGWADPVGREFGGPSTVGTIVGVVKDFHMHSLHLPIMPLYIRVRPESFDTVSVNGRNRRFPNFQRLSVKIRGGHIPRTLDFLRETWARWEPGYPFEPAFLDEIFGRAYRAERRLGTIFGVFAGLAVLIAGLGLLGLASFEAERRTREIGIRKVLGASSSGIVVLFSKEFARWVLLANVIAWPVGYLAMTAWLRNFAYRTSLTLPMFLGSALAALAVAAATIVSRTFRAASANPADSVRCE